MIYHSSTPNTYTYKCCLVTPTTLPVCARNPAWKLSKRQTECERWAKENICVYTSICTYICMWQAIVFVISEKFAQLLFLLLWLLLLLRSSRPGKECGQLVKCYDKWVESKPNCVCGMWCSSRWGSAKRTTPLWHEGSEALKQQRQQVEELNQTKRNVCVVIVPVSSMQVINSQAKYTNAHNFVCMYVGRHFYIAVLPTYCSAYLYECLYVCLYAFLLLPTHYRWSIK